MEAREMTVLENVYIAPSTTEPEKFARWLQRRWEQAYVDLIEPWGQATSNYASSLGHPCVRHLWYARMGAERAPVEPRTQMVFRRGQVIEDETISFLRTNMNIDWTRSQVSVDKDELLIGIKIDGGLRGRENRNDPYLVGEIKSLNAREYARVKDCGVDGIHQMLGCSWWVRRYVTQGVCYLHYFDEPGVIFILREPSSWGMKAVALDKRWPIYEKLWFEVEAKARAVNAAVESGEAPDRIPFTKSVCSMCDFSETVCHPSRQFDGVEILTHPDLVDAAERYLSLRDAAKEAEDTRGYLRDIVLATGRDHVVIGDGIEAKVRKSGKGKAVYIQRISGNLFFEEEDNE